MEIFLVEDNYFEIIKQALGNKFTKRNLKIWKTFRLVCKTFLKIVEGMTNYSEADWLELKIVYLSSYGNREGLEFLLSKGVDPSKKKVYLNYGVMTALNCFLGRDRAIKWACENGDEYSMKLLLKHPNVDPSVDNNWLIKNSAKTGSTNILKILLSDPRVDPSVDDNFTIIKACEKGFLEMVEILLEDSRVDPSSYDNLALLKASANGYSEVVQLLLKDDRVNPSSINSRCLIAASMFGNIEVLKILLKDPRVNPSALENSAEKAARQNGYRNIVKELRRDSRYVKSRKHSCSIL